jgi:hypothetical protein
MNNNSTLYLLFILVYSELQRYKKLLKRVRACVKVIKVEKGTPKKERKAKAVFSENQILLFSFWPKLFIYKIAGLKEKDGIG